uniref:Reverse transcriptase domain-containing protein n=1 Tax=Crocodylus porosus TaxID=8502 RepID=A0A7M4E807_CROPO
MWFPSSKKGRKEDPENYRPVSFTSILGKLFERIILAHVHKGPAGEIMLRGNQHRIIRGRSCQTNQVAFYNQVTKSLNAGVAVDIVFLDFWKAFDIVSHLVLIKKLGDSGVNTYTVKWVTNWLEGCTQRVVVDGSVSTWRDVGCGVPQGSVLGPALFNIFISDLDERVKSTLFKFADDTKLWGDVGTLEGRNRIQSDLDRLQWWVDENRMGFNTDKCKVMHLGRKNQQHTYRLGNSFFGSGEAEKDLGVIIDAKMNMGRQCGDAVRKANHTLSCIHRCISSRSKEMTLPLYTALVRPQLEYCIQFWALHFKRDVDNMERVQTRATCMIGGSRASPTRRGYRT